MNPPIRLELSVDDQRLDVFDHEQRIASFPVSTAEKGVGFREGSFRTPTGRFRIVGKIGEGAEIGTRFVGRVPCGVWRPGDEKGEDLVLTRILRLDGLDPENSNTLARYVYIHGTGDEASIGRPAGHGCIRLTNEDMVRLFDLVPEGAGLLVHPPSKPGPPMLFVDCDSTLSSIEGIDELARFRGEDVFERVVALTHAAMNGEIPLDEVFARRLEIIRPNREACEAVAELYRKTVVPGAAELVATLSAEGWRVVVLSGGFAPLIAPLAKDLGIRHVEAVPLNLDSEGNYLGFDASYPSTRNFGKNEIIREWKAALLPSAVVMVGDGMSDLETRPDVDRFVGFGGVVAREKVRLGADLWLPGVEDLAGLAGHLKAWLGARQA